MREQLVCVSVSKSVASLPSSPLPLVRSGHKHLVACANVPAAAQPLFPEPWRLQMHPRTNQPSEAV